MNTKSIIKLSGQRINEKWVMPKTNFVFANSFSIQSLNQTVYFLETNFWQSLLNLLSHLYI
jgi:hypothetical protein